jgi:hypothetical protein
MRRIDDYNVLSQEAPQAGKRDWLHTWVMRALGFEAEPVSPDPGNCVPAGGRAGLAAFGLTAL